MMNNIKPQNTMKKGLRLISTLAAFLLLAMQANAETYDRVVLKCHETSAAFADFKIVDENGNIIFQDDFSGKNKKNWRNVNKYESKYWKYQEGWFVQTDTFYSIHTMGCAVPLPSNRFDIYLKAKKLGGKEGFIIGYANSGKCVNIGGWGNTKHSFMDHHNSVAALSSEGSINVGQEYRIHISVRGNNKRCYLDDKLVTLWTDNAQECVDFILKQATADENSLLSCYYLNDNTVWRVGYPFQYIFSEKVKNIISCLRNNGYHLLRLAYKDLSSKTDNSWHDYNRSTKRSMPIYLAMGFLKSSELNKAYTIVKDPAVDYAALTQTGNCRLV